MIAALSILIIFCAFVVPLLSIVYKERMSIREQLLAMQELEASIHHFINDEYEDFRNTNITVEEVKEHVFKHCMNWTGTNGRAYEQCFLSSR
ncbi:hypothetical protein BkAM31D_17085 [Halalkalibacter krulwichiae]|uniref:Uncharacterized protein n=1 Tax=Halalkalibacter krulwichiae TaxID=199441 RepID=A0A1X9MIE9_9BACI|nr:hypothetical protein BkAM31D_17085 [Halalkalibacter krulwichiae]